ncbi:MAG TPA: nitroreductase family protein [Solirubrobacterales bacterium]|nr:nitroreductase family protein [Solirubrobacterales bacterium]
MDTFDAIHSRRNVRQFTERPIPDADLDRILAAGRLAPSAKNWQPWDFVLVTDREQLRRLAGVWQGGAHIADAAAAIGLVLPVLDDPKRRLTARFDLGQAAAFLQIAAADLGVGCGHSSVGDQELAREVLGLPDDREAALILDLGYPADRPLAPLKRHDRRPFDEVVHRDRW